MYFILTLSYNIITKLTGLDKLVLICDGIKEFTLKTTRYLVHDNGFHKSI